ncbi:MAG: hypothetical protein K5928_02555 [Prevotella sp.]|nr:hypothetical protein [Prevotella sp.]
MKKSKIFLAVAVIALASCTADDLRVDNSVQPSTDSTAIGFEVYTPRVTSSRGGYVGIIGNTQLQAERAQGGGFGVFAYYTDNNDYDPQSQPNFMYNQFVGYTAAGRWEYDPIKYWPNEYGSDATSDDADRVSFFAYAPYVDVVPSTGKLIKTGQFPSTTDEDKWGITGMTRNSANGDPIVKYIASFDQDKSVDLLWGTVGASKTQWDIVQSGSTQTLDEGLPWLNIQRPREAATQAGASQRVTFQFEHALSQLSINIDADVDEAGHSHTNALDSKARIWVRSITFNGFAIKGALDLNNTESGPKKAYWLDYNGTADLINGEAITVHDGLKDGKEGTDGAFASNEKTLGLNPQIIQSNSDIDNPGDVENAAWKTDKKGVTNEAVSLFRNWDADNNKYVASNQPIMVIPTGDDFDIEIVYDVETIDPNLAGYVSDGKTQGNSFECRVRKSVTFGGESALANGKHYTLNLHLGMNSVKFDATVEEWPEEADVEIHVPSTSRPTLFTITAEDILNNRGNEDNPRAWVICEDGHLHLCQNGCEVASDSDPDAPKYLMWDGTGTWEDSDKHNLLTQDDAPDLDNPLSCHKRKTAVVCYVGRTGLVETSPSANGSSVYHGLAIMLEDANGGPGSQWFTQNGGECVTSYAIGLGESIASSSAYLLTGIDNTNKLIAEGQGADPHSHDAAEQITLVYDADVWCPSSDQWCHTPPPGASQWFLPTIGQWNMIVRGLAATRTDLKFGQKLVEGDAEPLYSNEEFSAANLNKYIEKAAGGFPLGSTYSEDEKPSSNAYWSSTEFDEMGSDNHWAWSYNFQYGFAQAWDKVEKLFVRPVLAF